MSWFTSWLPVLPPLPSLNISLPSSIQSRLLSFLLKKYLGHLLKPGQFDASQIDSQIGSGHVHVTDLELDSSAVNKHLPGLPVALHQGVVGLVTARIPWPNPLTSTVGFSVKSLHLTFHLLPKSQRTSDNSPHLAESVASLAESFVHDELSVDQEARVAESFQAELAASIRDGDLNLPGGLGGGPEDEDNPSDMDPAGVKVFAAMIEGLLARFEFDAEDTRISLVIPGRARITVRLAELRYRTDESSPSTSASKSRSITLSGLTVTAANLTTSSDLSSSATSTQPATSASVSTLQTPRRSPSPSSSSSSLDEDTHMEMSQSLAFLPPRPPSPASSVASSMYQSALSMTPGPHEDKPLPDPFEPEDTTSGDLYSEENFILSFGKEPIVLRLTTPPPSPPRRQAERNVAYDEALKLSVDAGVIACGLRAWHIRCIVDIADILSSHSSPTSASSSGSPSTLSMTIDLSLKLKGIVVLLLPALSDSETQFSNNQLAGFFDKPLVPPRLSMGYLRLHVERIAASGSMVLGPSRSSLSVASSTSSRPSPDARTTLSASVNELSVFVFQESTPEAKEFLASPILITDPNLSEGYATAHSHPDIIMRTGECPEMPVFDITDWTNPVHHLNGMRVSQWRAKHKSSANENKASAPAVSLSFLQKSFLDKRNKVISHTDVEVSIASLHVMANLRQCVNVHVLGFVEELTRPKLDDKQATEDNCVVESDEDEEEPLHVGPPPAIPASGLTRKRHSAEWERRRLEQSILQDLDLDLDYGLRESPISSPLKAKGKKRSKSKRVRSKLTVKIPMVRLQVRCPPLAGNAPRSGPLILDIHDISVSNDPPSQTTNTRFESDSINGDVFASVELRRLVVSTACPTDTKAKAVLSLGPLTGEEGSMASGSSLNPLISIINRPSGKTSIAVSVPSLYVNLTKPTLDALQYGIDDASQLIEVTFGSDRVPGEGPESREASIIGSRFFAKSRSGSDITVGPPPAAEEDSIVKVSISEVFLRFNIPEVPLGSEAVTLTINSKRVALNKPMDMIASDAVVELKPDGKDETLISVAVMDLTIKHGLSSGGFSTVLQLTAPRSLTTTPQNIINLTFKSLTISETGAKESRVKLALWGFTFNFYSDITWVQAIVNFFKAPPGAFESVVPSERTRISLKVTDGSIAAFTPNYPGCLVLHVGDLEFGTTLIGNSPDLSLRLVAPDLALLLIDNKADIVPADSYSSTRHGVNLWKKQGFALLAEVSDFHLKFSAKPSDTRVAIERIILRLHLCADTGSALGAFISDMTSAFQPPVTTQTPKPKRAPAVILERSSYGLASLDDSAFKRPPEIGPAPDMIYDDLPTNLDYLDESFGAAAGLRELRDDDLDDFDVEGSHSAIVDEGGIGITSTVGGETIKMLRQNIEVVENYFDNLPPEPQDGSAEVHDTTFLVQLNHAEINAFLYDGYDWVKTRKTIEESVKEMRKRLAKIRQLVANGQMQDPILEEETTALLYNSVYIGLSQDVDEMEPGALIAAIDEELKDDFETISQSSWQSLKPQGPTKPSTKAPRVQGKRLTRAKSPNIEFRLAGMKLNVHQYVEDAPLVSKIFATVKDVEILDHMKSSTWSKFLTSLRSDSRGNIRETDSDMARIELKNLHPVQGHPSVEARFRAKLLPLRLHVDQDALDFLKRFFSFQDPHAPPSAPKDPDDDIYFQFAEIFPVDLKLDYKPRRVDYRALKEGKTIELMNFFHFDGAEMTLRHITLAGISGWPRLFDLLNDLWTPDVKATQLVEVISGVAPIRSVVNVGSGIADLVLLPISQYKKDGRIVRGVQKGATSFVKSTAIEAIKLGARLATGTQVILEQAEGVIGGQFESPVTAETLQFPILNDELLEEGLEVDSDKFSKYAEQPADIKEGVQSAYRSLHKNLNSAAQTILAVPMEVYERSGNEGPVRSVIRAVPIAVLKPMIGASEAVSKTLLGLHNTLDPNVRQDNQAKYKQR